MKLVLDMNLSPAWVATLAEAGHEAVHWSAVGPPDAMDEVIADWAVQSAHVIVTADLDFGDLLTLTHTASPSVVLLRAREAKPSTSAAALVEVLAECEAALEAGALVVVDRDRKRVRILPLGDQ